MKLPTWFALTALLFGCAPKTLPSVTDAGAMPSADPYDHRQNPQYTTGAMAGFRSLYVDPKSYPSSMKPVTPLPAPPIQVEGPDLPEDLFPAILIQADLTKLNEGRTFETLVNAISESRDGVVANMPSTGIVLFPAPASEKLRARALRRIGNTRVGDTSIRSVSSIEVVDGLPESAANTMVREPAEGTERMLITLVPRPPAPIVPVTGDLIVENTTTAWAEVVINDAKVGVIGPLALGTIANVKAGTYQIQFTLPNGYSWSEKRMTTGAK